jgi:hypothetical protein
VDWDGAAERASSLPLPRLQRGDLESRRGPVQPVPLTFSRRTANRTSSVSVRMPRAVRHPDRSPCAANRRRRSAPARRRRGSAR